MSLATKPTLSVLLLACSAGITLPSISLASTASEMYRTKALQVMASGDLDGAMKLFDQALGADSKDAAARFYRGMLYSRLQRYPTAAADLERAKSDGLAQWKLDFELGYAYFHMKRYEDAEQALMLALASNPEDAATNYYLGVIAYQRQDYARSMGLLELAAEKESLAPSAAYMRGNAAFKTGQLAEAERILYAAVGRYPDSDYIEYSQELLDEVRRKRSEKPWSVSLVLGASHDTNVGLFADEYASTAGIEDKSDYRTQFGLDASYRLLDREATRITAAYQFFQSYHADLDMFDLRNHALSLDVKSGSGPTRAGVGVQYIVSELDGEDYRDSYALNPYLMFAHGLQRSSMLSLNVRRDDYQQSSQDGRDGNISKLSYRYYWLPETYRFFYAGVDYLSDVTDDDNYDNRGYGVEVGTEIPISDYRLNANLVLQHRDFSSSVDDREDDYMRATVGLVVPLSGNLDLEASYVAFDNQSTAADYDYTREVINLMLRWEL